VLEPRGRLILTTPYSSKYQLLKWKNADERIYNQEKIDALFASWKRLKEEYYAARTGKTGDDRLKRTLRRLIRLIQDLISLALFLRNHEQSIENVRYVGG
jgi:hypothetical protein